MPRTTLSSIENGGRAVEVTKLFKLLNRMNISIEEYSFLLNLDFLNDEKIGAQELINFKEEDANGIFIKKYEKTNDIFYYHLHIQNKLISEKDNRNDDDFVMPIKKHLDQVESWDNFELAMFRNCIFIIELYKLIIMIKKNVSHIVILFFADKMML